MPDWLQRDWCSSFVLTLGHFLWQGILVAALLAIGLRVVRSVAARYWLSLVALLLMAACPVATLGWLLLPQKPIAVAETTPVDRDVADSPAVGAADIDVAVVPETGLHDLKWSGRDAGAAPVAAPSLRDVDVAMPASAPFVERSWWQRFAPQLMATYLGGVALMLLRLVAGLWGGRRLRRRVQLIDDSALLAAMQRQATALGLKLLPVLAYCERVTVPTVVGVLKPMILLPIALTSGLSPEQIESVLAHELAHLRRYDHLVNLLQRVIESLLFFHPAMWWVSHRIRQEREHCCDDLVVACGAMPLDYAKSLLRVAELSRATKMCRSLAAVSLLATDGKPSNLRQRIARLLGESASPSLRLSPRALLLTITIPLVALIATIQSGASPQPTSRLSGENDLTDTRSQAEPVIEKTPARSQALPENEKARALFEKWERTARANGDVPGGTLGPLVRVMRNFVKNNPTHEGAPKFAELLKRVDVTRDWSREDAVKLLDEVAGIYASLPEWVLGENRFTLGGDVVVGKKLPEELKDAPWGEAQPNGLRVAWLLEPIGTEHRLNTSLKSRVLFHNSGKNAVVFRALTWNQPGPHKAVDAQGKEINVTSVEWTTIPMTFACRLAPGEFHEVIGAGIGVGPNKDDEDWRDGRRDVRVGSWIEAKAGDEVTFSAASVDCDGRDGPQLEGVVGDLQTGPRVDPKSWWLKFILERLSLDAPLPADKDERGRLLDRVVRDLFGNAPTEAELTAFKYDATATALEALAIRLAERAGFESFSGSLTSGSTKFKVLPVDPDAEKKPRTATGPGQYPLGGNVTFVVTRRPIGKRVVNEAQLSFSQTDATKAALKPHPVSLPDDYDSWMAAWMRGGTVLWIAEKADGQEVGGKKSSIRRIDFTNPGAVKESVIANPRSSLPQAVLDVLQPVLGLDQPANENKTSTAKSQTDSGNTPELRATKKPEGAEQAAHVPKDADTTASEMEFKFLVLASNGAPVAGAKVTPWGVSHSWSSSLLERKWCPEVVTDAQGVALVTVSKEQFARAAANRKLAGLQPTESVPKVAQLALKIDHPLHPVWSQYIDVGEPARIVLSDAATIEVRPRRWNDDSPLRDVIPLLSEHEPSPTEWKTMKEQSHKDGSLTISRIDRGSQQASRWLRLVHAPQDEPAWFSELIDLKSLDVKAPIVLTPKLRPGVRVSGRLALAVPRPIKNGRVVGMIAGGASDARTWYWSAEAVIKEDGTFAIESLPANENLQLIALCDGWVSRSPTVAEMTAYSKEHDYTVSYRGTPAAIGAALKSGKVLLTKHSVYPQVVRTQTPMIEPILEMERTADCEVKVVDTEGRAIPNAVVTASPNQHWFDLGANLLGTGSDALKIAQARFATGESPATAEANSLFKVKTNAQGVAVIKNLPVSNEARVPVTTYFIGVTHEEFAAPYLRPSGGRGVTVELSPQKAERVTVSMRMKSQSKPVAELGPVHPQAELGNEIVAPNGEIHGVLLGKDSQPVVGATVACGALINDSGKGGGSNSATDAMGRYRLKVPSPGIYNVWVKDAGAAGEPILKANDGQSGLPQEAAKDLKDEKTNGVESQPTWTAAADDGLLVEGGKVTTSKLQLIRGTMISGTLLDADQKPVPKVTVYCHSLARPATGGPQSVRTNEKGEFSFWLVPGRAYFYVAEKEFGRAEALIDVPRNGRPEPIEPLKLTLTNSEIRFGDDSWLRKSTQGTAIIRHENAKDVQGTVVDGEGNPIVGARVFRYDGPIVTTNDKGEFTVTASKGTQFVMYAAQPDYHAWVGTPTSGDVLKIVLEKKATEPGPLTAPRAPVPGDERGSPF